MSEHTVSVLIPTYNSGPYLREALGSVLAQTWTDLQVVVVDNASTDDTTAIVEELARGDERIELVRNPSNIGPVANFRACLSRASGAYVKYLMSDDVLEPDCVQRLVAPLQADPTVVLATSRRQRIAQDGTPLPDNAPTTPIAREDRRVSGLELGNLALNARLNVIGEPSTVLFRNGIIDADSAFTYRGVPFRVIADVSLWIRLLSHGDAFYAADALSRFRQHPGQDQRSLRMMLRGEREWLRLKRLARQDGFLTRGHRRLVLDRKHQRVEL